MYLSIGTSAAKEKSLKSKHGKKNQHMSNGQCGQYNPLNPYHPISSCGPLDNEFLQFYAELYASAKLYSDPDFQRKILCPCPFHTERCACGTSKINSKPQPKVKKEKGKCHHRHVQVQFQSPGFIATTSAPKVSTSSEIGGSSVRRQVSFSKHSPRSSNLIHTTKKKTVLKIHSKNHIIVPRVTIQGNSSSCWSSDTEESDTTETEKASSTVDEDKESDADENIVKDIPTHPEDLTTLITPTPGDEVN